MPLVPPGSKTEANFLYFLGVELGVMGALAIFDASIAISTPFEVLSLQEVEKAIFVRPTWL